MITKTDGESYLHAAAKSVLASWLRELPGGVGLGINFRTNDKSQHRGVFEEYPLTYDMLRHGGCWPDRPWPDYDWMKSNGPQWHKPLEGNRLHDWSKEFIIADIAVQHCGGIDMIFEVVHKSPPSLKKMTMIEQAKDVISINGSLIPVGVDAYYVDASWILAQRKVPDEIMCLPESFIEAISVQKHFNGAVPDLIESLLIPIGTILEHKGTQRRLPKFV